MRARLLLPALVVATCAHGRLRQMTILPIAAPPVAAQAWAAMEACSRAPERPGGALTDVHWFVADLLAADRFHSMVGVWLPPDTIVLDLTHALDSLTIAHELLHHRLRGAVNGQMHPFYPFVIPCGLIRPPIGG